MTAFVFVFALLIGQDSVPFKPQEEYELTMDYAFRQRVLKQQETDIHQPASKTSGPLPFLKLNLKVLRLRPEEARIKISNNLDEHMLSKKLEEGETYSFEPGFTADMKDRVQAHEFTILFLSSDRKQAISKIVVHVAKDGTFLVNNQVRGKL